MCCVKGCCKVESSTRSLFQVPVTNGFSVDGLDGRLAVKRRSAWLEAIGIQTFIDMDRAQAGVTSPLLYVCSDHFKSSKTNFFFVS